MCPVPALRPGQVRAGSGGGHLVDLLRGVRLAFLSVAALAVAAGWLIGLPLPFVVALIIAGIDVITNRDSPYSRPRRFRRIAHTSMTTPISGNIKDGIAK